jgi:hypothetical protein
MPSNPSRSWIELDSARIKVGFNIFLYIYMGGGYTKVFSLGRAVPIQRWPASGVERSVRRREGAAEDA